VIGQDNTLTSTGGSGTGGSTAGTGSGETTTGAGGIGSGNQTPIEVQAPVDTSGNQVTVIGQGNTSTSTSGSTSGGTTGGVVSPPTGGTVTPPTGGTATTVAAPQGSATPGSSVLPNTGLGGALPWLAALGLLLVGLGSLLTRRGRPAIAPGAVRAG
jgi:LPXTG-motif cell wall-anchored protein